MVVALAPAQRNGSSLSKRVLTPTQLKVAELVAAGHSTSQIARRLAHGDPHRAKLLRAKFRRWQEDPLFQDVVMAKAKAKGLKHIGPSVEAIGKRAGRGRPDAAKLLWSMTGFHNDKVQHEHSGDIQINVSIPRPQTTVDQLGPGKDSEDYVDADVVEE